MKNILGSTFDIADSLLQREGLSEVEPPHSVEQLRRELELGLPKTGLGEEEAMKLVAEVVRRTPSTSGRRFFNQLFAGREPLAGAAEMLAAMLNTSMYTFKIGGVQILIENEVIRRLCELACFTEGDGTFAPGGSMGNLVGLFVAAQEARPDFRDQGMSGARLRVYASAEAHYSLRKNAGILGLGRANVRRVAVDSSARMDCVDLQRKIDEDRQAGHEPFCIVGTAGTTVAGAFDPLVKLANVAEAERLWFHVDGAYGGSFLLHPKHRRKLDGLKRADSMTWNAHKMMGVPMPCAAILVKQRGLLHQHFDEAAEYLFQQDSEELNPGTKSLQCGRRNDAFKLWATWQSLGDDGWRDRIDRQLRLVQYCRQRIVEHPDLELALEPESLNICFTVRGKASDTICERLGAQGTALVGYGVVAGRKIIRLVTANPEVTEEDLAAFFDALLEVAKALPTTQDGLATVPS